MIEFRTRHAEEPPAMQRHEQWLYRVGVSVMAAVIVLFLVPSAVNTIAENDQAALMGGALALRGELYII